MLEFARPKLPSQIDPAVCHYVSDNKTLKQNLPQKSFNKSFNRHGLIVREVRCSPGGDEISNPGLNCTIISLHHLFIT